MDPTRKQITKDGVTYIFRLPNAIDFVQVDLKARELRGGVSDGIGVAFSFSQSIALLNQICEQPQGVDFGQLPFHIMNSIYDEVNKWLESFRDSVAGREQEGTVGQGQG